MKTPRDIIDAEAIKELKRALDARRYFTVCVLTRELPARFRRGSPEDKVYEYLFSSDPPLLRLIRLFLSEAEISGPDLRVLFGSGLTDFLIDSGILEKRSGSYRSLMSITPFKNNYFLAGGGVFPLFKEQNIFANALVPGQYDMTLELCSGSGIFSVLSSPYSGRVQALDINPRAVEIGRFNALLNNADNMTCIQSDLFQNAKGAYDLILANPPYNPSFGNRDDLCLHAGRGGEDILFEIIGKLPRYLNEGGLCQIISRYFYKKGRTYYDRLRDIVDVGKFNIFLLQSFPRDIFTLSNLVKTSWSVGDAAALFDFYARESIDRESYGILSLRRVNSQGRFAEQVIDFDNYLDREIYPLIRL